MEQRRDQDRVEVALDAGGSKGDDGKGTVAEARNWRMLVPSNAWLLFSWQSESRRAQH